MNFPYQIIMMYRNGEVGDYGYFLCAKKLYEDLLKEAKREYEHRGHIYEPYLLTLNKLGFPIERKKIPLDEIT
jgi:hypothetical protein